MIEAARELIGSDDTPSTESAAAQLVARWHEGQQRTAQLLGDDPQFVHFTSERDAHRIATTGVLGLSSVICAAVYAVAVGGRDVPTVQQGASPTGFGRVAGERTHAVLFHADEMPDTAFVEEVIWHRTTPLKLRDAVVITRAEARELLDDSAGLPD